MSTTVCQCVPSPHRHLDMSRHPASLYSPTSSPFDSPLLFAHYPLPAPPPHSSSYLHPHPFSLHSHSSPFPSALYDPLALPYHHFRTHSRPSFHDPPPLSLYEDLPHLRRRPSPREQPRGSASGPSSLASSSPLSPISSSPPSPFSSPASPSPPASSSSVPALRSPAPSPLPRVQLTALLATAHRLSARELGLQSEWDAQPQCAICLGAFTVGCHILTLPACQHVFDRECVRQWLEKSSRCPLCRREVELLQDGSGDGTQKGGAELEGRLSGGALHADVADDHRSDGLRGWRYA